MTRTTTIFLFTALFSACAAKQPKPDPNQIWTEQGSPYAFHKSVVLTLLAAGESAQAMPNIKRMLLIQPNSAEAHYLLARCYLEMKLYKETRLELTRVIEIDRNYAAAHSLLGMLLDRLGEHAKAEQAHRQALALAPGYVQYQNNLAFGLYLQDRYEEAIAAFQAALAIDPQLKRIHNNIGFAFARMQRYDDALRHFRLGGSEAEALNNLGYAYEREHRADEAIEQYKKALQEDRELSPARENLDRLVGVKPATGLAQGAPAVTVTIVEESRP